MEDEEDVTEIEVETGEDVTDERGTNPDPDPEPQREDGDDPPHTDPCPPAGTDLVNLKSSLQLRHVGNLNQTKPMLLLLYPVHLKLLSLLFL